jgi:hypothetical protein
MTKRNWGIEPKCYEPPPLPSGRSRRAERLNHVLASLLILVVAVGSLLILLHSVRAPQ